MTRARDNLVRIGLLILSICLAGLAFAVGAAVSDWNGFPRTVIVGVTAAASAAAFWGGVEIRTAYGERTPLRLRRYGEPSETAAVPPVAGTGPLQPVRIALHPKNSLIAGAIFLAMAVGAWGLASRTDFSDDGAIVTIVALATAPWLTYFTVRSALRIMLARRAIEITSEALTLGPALGYWPRLRLPRESIVDIVLPENPQEEISIVLSDRTYRVSPKHLVDPATVADRVRAAWPERAAGIEPIPSELADLELTPQRATHAPEAVQQLAKRAIARRRTWWLIALVAGLAVLSVGTVWYVAQRQANDRLTADGVRVVGTVTDVDGSSRGPDTMRVTFSLQGEEVAASIESGWFGGYRPSAVGEPVRLLVDPEDPSFVRLPESRNIKSWTWVVLMISVVWVMVGFLKFKEQRTLEALLEHGLWGRRKVRFEISGRRRTLMLAADTELGEAWVSVGTVAGNRIADGIRDAWSCEDSTSILVVPDDTTSVATVAKASGPFGSTFKPTVTTADTSS